MWLVVLTIFLGGMFGLGFARKTTLNIVLVYWLMPPAVPTMQKFPHENRATQEACADIGGGICMALTFQ
jgi:hypothetical protein